MQYKSECSSIICLDDKFETVICCSKLNKTGLDIKLIDYRLKLTMFHELYLEGRKGRTFFKEITHYVLDVPKM